MILLFFTLDKHVVHIYFYVPPNLFAEHLVYQSLVRGSRIFQIERHDLVAVETLAGDESGLLLIFLYHLYLVILEESVHKGKEFMPDR